MKGSRQAGRNRKGEGDRRRGIGEPKQNEGYMLKEGDNGQRTKGQMSSFCFTKTCPPKTSPVLLSHV